MSLSLYLFDSNKKISQDINKAIGQFANQQMNKNKTRVLARIRAALPFWVASSPEIQSLNAEGVLNSLNAQFGLLPGMAGFATGQIINAISDSIIVDIKNFSGSNLKNGGVSFYIQPNDFKNLLDLPSGFVLTSTANLHWLEWLLLLGSKTIVYGYSYEPDTSGRSGGGTMTTGSVWRVPPEYAGNIGNNFITRLLRNRDRELQKILQGIFD